MCRDGGAAGVVEPVTPAEMWVQAAAETALVLLVGVLFACAVAHAFVARR